MPKNINLTTSKIHICGWISRLKNQPKLKVILTQKNLLKEEVASKEEETLNDEFDILNDEHNM